MRYRSWAAGLLLVAAFALPMAGCGDDDNDDRFGNCGNDVVDAGEECDDGNLEDDDDCLSTCEQATCGDGFVNVGEEDCDGTNLGGETCASLGEGFGTLRCDGSCEFDTSDCGGGGGDPTQTPTPDATPTPTEVTGGATATPTTASTPSGNACTSGDTITAVVSLDTTYGGAVVAVAYPASANIPGNGGAQTVIDRVTFAASGGVTTVNDQDTNSDSTDDTVIASFGSTTDNAAGTFVTIEFDCLDGQPAPAPGDFTCTVESGSDSQGNPLALVCSLAITGP